MPTLVAFMIRHFGNGFLLGTAAALAGVILAPGSTAAQLIAGNLVGLVLVLFGIGSSFGMGSLATALWLDDGRGDG